MTQHNRHVSNRQTAAAACLLPSASSPAARCAPLNNTVCASAKRAWLPAHASLHTAIRSPKAATAQVHTKTREDVPEGSSSTLMGSQHSSTPAAAFAAASSAPAGTQARLLTSLMAQMLLCSTTRCQTAGAVDTGDAVGNKCSCWSVAWLPQQTLTLLVRNLCSRRRAEVLQAYISGGQPTFLSAHAGAGRTAHQHPSAAQDMSCCTAPACQTCRSPACTAPACMTPPKPSNSVHTSTLACGRSSTNTCKHVWSKRDVWSKRVPFWLRLYHVLARSGCCLLQVLSPRHSHLQSGNKQSQKTLLMCTEALCC